MDLKNGVISCSMCGEFGHSAQYCPGYPDWKKLSSVSKSETMKTFKATTAKCSVCGSTGHWRNSNNKRKSGKNTTMENADCPQWSEELLADMKANAILNARSKDMDYAETLGFKYDNPFLDWIPTDHIVPPFLHVTKLGGDQRGIKMIQEILAEHDRKKTNGRSNHVEQLTNLLYDDLHVLENRYHGGTYDGNHMEKIVKNIPLVLSLLDNLPEQEAVIEYFEPMIKVDSYSNMVGDLTTEQIADFKSQCLKYGQTIHSPEWKKSVPSKLSSVPIKGHIVEAHLYQFAEKYGFTGSASESTVELVHHDVHQTKTNPSDFIPQVLHKNLLKTCATLEQEMPVPKIRGTYWCGKCLRISHTLVKKAGHSCPHKNQ